MKNVFNKTTSGYTLVETIVVVVMVAFLSTGLVLLFTNMSKAFNKRILESQLLIEMQTVETSITESLKSAMYYEVHDNVLEVFLTRKNTDFWYYYILDKPNRIMYLKAYDTKQDDLDAVRSSVTNRDFMARYITEMSVSPSKINAEDNKGINDIEYLFQAKEQDLNYEVSGSLKMRNGKR